MKLDVDGPAEGGTSQARTSTLTTIATWDDKKLFAVDDIYCAPPLAVYDGDLYAGSQKDGALYRFE